MNEFVHSFIHSFCFYFAVMELPLTEWYLMYCAENHWESMSINGVKLLREKKGGGTLTRSWIKNMIKSYHVLTQIQEDMVKLSWNISDFLLGNKQRLYNLSLPPSLPQVYFFVHTNNIIQRHVVSPNNCIKEVERIPDIVLEMLQCKS